MSALRAACIRTSLGAPLRSPSVASQPRLVVSRPPYTQRAALVRSQQVRFQSSAGDNADAKQQPPPPPPPPPSLKMVLGALRQSMSLRPLLGAFRGQSLRKLFQQSPEELVLALALLAGVSCVLVYVVYTYFNYFQSRQFTRFPPEIAKSLRRALYYSNYAPDPKLALKWYKIALEQCEQHGLDPFSDEVMGVKIQLAAWLERLGSYQNSIEVLEALFRDCDRWVEKMEQAVKAGQVDRNGMLVGTAASRPARPDEAASETEREEPAETLFGKRTRVLGKMVGINVKLGELYADEHVMQGDAAGERLVWAVETVLKELQRRQIQGLREGEGDWMSPEEIGGALEALANHYESKSQHYLAAPLYLQAISLSPPKSCHTAVLMNNLAISLAQQPVDVPSDLTGPGRSTRAALLASARSWANQAHTTGSRVTGEDRTPECDEACAVALCNLGEIAAMMGDKDESKKKFKESLALSKRIGFGEGVSQSQDGLKAASSTPAITKA